jgi:hypothetical protein
MKIWVLLPMGTLKMCWVPLPVSVTGCQLAGGRVVESGSHAELVALNGHYARLRGEATGP